MITFHNSCNIIVTKRNNCSTKNKNSDKKEKSSNNFYKHKKNKNKINKLFNKTSLSLSSLKTKTKLKKNSQNIIGSQIKKKTSNKNTPIKNNEIINIYNNKENNFIINNNDILFQKSKSNQIANNINYNLLLNNDINKNSYPEPEPMPIKFSKNNNIVRSRPNSSKNNNNNFSPNNILSNIDLDIDNNKNDIENIYYEKIQSEKKYYSSLQKFFEKNNLKEVKKYKINSNNFQNFIQNINNNDNIKDNKFTNIYDKRIIFILSNLDLDDLINKFSYHCITFNDLFLLTKQDLLEMKIPIGQRNRLMHFLDKYKSLSNNYDFNEITKYLDKYKKIYKNNSYIDRDISNNINTMPNFKNNNYQSNCIKDNINKEKENLNKINLYLNNNNIKNEPKKIINNNIYESIKKNKEDKFTNYEIDNNNILYQSKNNENIEKQKHNNLSNQTNNLIKNDNDNNINKNENINISIFKRNNSNIEKNKYYPTNSSISNSKGVSIDDFNSQENEILNKRNNKKNNSTIISNNDTTSTTINNKIRSNHFLQKCNNILNEVNNFNTIYTQMKQKTQNRNKQISLLLNKKNNFDYFKDKINYNEFKINKEKEEVNNIYRLYNINNVNNIYLNENDIKELNDLKEESIRDLNKELKLNLWK